MIIALIITPGSSPLTAVQTITLIITPLLIALIIALLPIASITAARLTCSPPRKQVIFLRQAIIGTASTLVTTGELVLTGAVGDNMSMASELHRCDILLLGVTCFLMRSSSGFTGSRASPRTFQEMRDHEE